MAHGTTVQSQQDADRYVYLNKEKAVAEQLYDHAVITLENAKNSEKAAEQAAMFATKQVDPGAPTYSLEFLRQHPEISNESVPWHMHTDLPHTVTAAGGGQSK